MSPRHFLDLDEVTPLDIRAILESSKKRKAARAGLGQAEPDADKPIKG